MIELKFNYYLIIMRGKMELEYYLIEELNTAIQLITYCMRQRRTEYYKNIDKSYSDEFTYEEMVFDT